jgi:hypothetical protein
MKTRLPGNFSLFLIIPLTAACGVERVTVPGRTQKPGQCLRASLMDKADHLARECRVSENDPEWTTNITNNMKTYSDQRERKMLMLFRFVMCRRLLAFHRHCLK